MGCGWSEMVNFIAVTTVVRVRELVDVRADRNSGSSLTGSIKHSLPRHSATTFLEEKRGLRFSPLVDFSLAVRSKRVTPLSYLVPSS